MIIFDSNIWIAFYHENDTLHDKAKKLFQTTTGIVWVPEYIFIEVCSVLHMRVDKKMADAFSDRLATSNRAILTPINTELFSAMRTYFRDGKHLGLSFIDVSLLYLSQFHTVHTFDKKLANAIKKQK